MEPPKLLEILRLPKKAGTWYVAESGLLDRELDRNLRGVAQKEIGCSTLPIPRARVILAPHAGYEYSGECAAWAYRCLDLSAARRIFILGPSHVLHMRNCALSEFSHFGTPHGPLLVDRPTVYELLASSEAEIGLMPQRADLREHSIEMHLPYLYKRLQQTLGHANDFPKIIPIVVGNLDRAAEARMGRVLAPYLHAPDTAFIVSSDFCHWGDSFGFTPYSRSGALADLHRLAAGDVLQPADAAVEASIDLIDRHALDALTSGSHARFADSLDLTGNTVCGRHAIAVMMAAMEAAAADAGRPEPYTFTLLRYTTSGKVKKNPPIADSTGHSVSYASAYAVI